jgi:hypothetical protein
VDKTTIYYFNFAIDLKMKNDFKFKEIDINIKNGKQQNKINKVFLF